VVAGDGAASEDAADMERGVSVMMGGEEEDEEAEEEERGW